MKFGQLILRRIVKIVATKCQILRLKCSPAGGAYSAPPDPLAGFKGPYFQGKGDIGRRGGEAGGGKEGSEGTPVCIFKFFLE